MTALSPSKHRADAGWLGTRRRSIVAQASRYLGRHTDLVRAAIAVGGIGLGVLSLAALFISEGSGLFGFVEHGYRMTIVVAIVAEAAAAVFLAAFLVANGTDLRQIPTSKIRPRSSRARPY